MQRSRYLSYFALLALVSWVLVVVAFIRYFVWGTPVVTYRDELVRAGSIRRPLDVLAVHSGPDNFVSVDGRTYRHVRGLPPYYLRLDRLDSILIVTDAGDDSVELHIIKIGSWAEIRIPGKKLSFGGEIGYTNSHESVEKEDSREIVLLTRYPNGTKRVFLDLDNKKVARIEDDEFDKDGRVKSHNVYVDGKRVE
jgi:hypothetical protein